ncbi:MAG: ATPase [Bacteroidetes bacterium]|nr:ATPase [Bacteroidota bacterium]
MIPTTNIVEKVLSVLKEIAHILIPFLSVAATLLLIYDLGFTQSETFSTEIKTYYSKFVFVVYFFILLRIDYKKLRAKRFEYLRSQYYLFLTFSCIWIYEFVLPVLFPGYTFLNSTFQFYVNGFLILFLFFTEVSIGSLNISRLNKNPAAIFIFSFAIVILIGAGLLMLPKATYTSMTITDALFTSTSAVCVTGLIVVDTAHRFTPMGQNILAILIQIGGLGILTFTSFFGMYLRTSISYQDQLLLGSMNNEAQLSNIFKTVVRIIVLTRSSEIIAAVLIFFTLEPDLFSSHTEQVRFAIFHSISAFCNAGFSLLTDGMYDVNYRFNYSLQIILMTLIVLGGLGFNIILNYLRYVKYYLIQKFRSVFYKKKFLHQPRLININSKIVFITTFSLIVFGFIMNLILEWENTLADRSLSGKLITALFASITPRTAGFNTVDMTILMPSTILIYYLLMLIGGSPGSTAGGIKTTTFAVAVINTLSIARGKDRVELYKREISVGSIRRALSVLALALLFIGISVFLITLMHPEFELMSVIFECISAFSTVGLTLGITPFLSDAAKLVLVLTMFVGRIGTLTLIVALFRKVKTLNYAYPKESILIS